MTVHTDTAYIYTRTQDTPTHSTVNEQTHTLYTTHKHSHTDICTHSLHKDLNMMNTPTRRTHLSETEHCLLFVKVLIVKQGIHAYIHTYIH